MNAMMSRVSKSRGRSLRMYPASEAVQGGLNRNLTVALAILLLAVESFGGSLFRVRKVLCVRESLWCGGHLRRIDLSLILFCSL